MFTKDHHIRSSIPNLDTQMRKTITDKEHMEKEIESKWRKTINRRLSEDKTTATRVLRKKHYINTAQSTWAEALHTRHSDLPEDWINRNVVF